MVIELSGGFSSQIYLVTDITSEYVKGHAKKFLVRLFGGKLVDEDEALKVLTPTEENLILQAYNLAGIDPKLFGVIEGGRIEEFIPSHILTEADFEDSDIMLQLARKLARFHALQLPISKQPNDICKPAEINFAQYDADVFQKIVDYVKCEDAKQLIEFDWRSEIEWIRNILPKIGGRFVSVHGDLYKSNILVRDEADTLNEKVTLIDYELAATDYRGRDFGDWFPFKIFELKDGKFVKVCEYPEEMWRKTFITEYLRIAKELAEYEFDEQGLDSVEHVMMEADFFTFPCLVRSISFFIKQKEDGFMLQMPIELGHSFMVSKLSAYIDDEECYMISLA